jgi:Tol biopolymer transport system component
MRIRRLGWCLRSLIGIGFVLVASAYLRAPAPDIWAISLRTGVARQVTNHPAADEEPAWAPDGRSILFDSDRNGNADIFVVNPDGTNLRQLTTSPAKEDHGAWSPDGNWIAYQHEEEGNTDVWVMRADGTEQRRLTSHRAAMAGPIGRLIL